MQWLLVNPKHGMERTLPPRAEIDELVARMNALSASAIALGNRASDAAREDKLRTAGGDTT
jgi:hypothetical protein